MDEEFVLDDPVLAYEVLSGLFSTCNAGGPPTLSISLPPNEAPLCIPT